MSASFEKNSIIFANGKNVIFDYNITKHLILGSTIIILLSVPIDKIYNKNVIAFLVNGDFLWEIQESAYQGLSKDCPFINMAKIAENEILLFNWCDVILRVEANTGKILERMISK